MMTNEDCLLVIRQIGIEQRAMQNFLAASTERADSRLKRVIASGDHAAIAFETAALLKELKAIEILNSALLSGMQQRVETLDALTTDLL